MIQKNFSLTGSLSTEQAQRDFQWYFYGHFDKVYIFNSFIHFCLNGQDNILHQWKSLIGRIKKDGIDSKTIIYYTKTDMLNKCYQKMINKMFKKLERPLYLHFYENKSFTKFCAN